jgi:hypothetical protein
VRGRKEEGGMGGGGEAGVRDGRGGKSELAHVPGCSHFVLSKDYSVS